MASWLPPASWRKINPRLSPIWSSRRMTMLAVEPWARATRARLSNPFSGVSDTFIGIEQFTVLIQRKTIGHPGDIVGDYARQRLAVNFDTAQHMAGHLARLAHVSLEQTLEHPARLTGHPADSVVTIKPLAHQLLELRHHRRHRGTEARQRPPGAP